MQRFRKRRTENNIEERSSCDQRGRHFDVVFSTDEAGEDVSLVAREERTGHHPSLEVGRVEGSRHGATANPHSSPSE
jgi:hypothetical protein